LATTIFDADQEAVLADEAPCLLIEAPPGSGKTYTAIRLIARDIDSGRIGPTQRALVLTFSRNARAQLDGYASEILSAEQRSRAEITNYHSWFWAKLSQFQMSLGLPADLEIASDAQRDEEVRAAMAAEGVKVIERGKGRNLADYSHALEYELAPGRPERLPDPLDKGAEVAARMLERHRASGRLHHDDLAYYAWRLLDGSRTLRELWRHKYPVIVLDEYQDTSPLQAAIVARLAGAGHRLYAFADPLQQIYTWRDASKKRLEEFRTREPSEHRLRTLHRYRHRPDLQAWMQQARDVLLDQRASVSVALPSEIEVRRYDPNQPERGRVRGAEARELWHLDNPIASAFRSSGIETIAVLCRRRDQLAVLERRLASNFRCGRLRAAEEGLDYAEQWAEGYASAVSPEHHAARLLEMAQRVAPRHKALDLDAKIEPNGISAARLRSPRREIAEGISKSIALCVTLSGAFQAAQATIALARRGQDPRVIDWDMLYAIRRVLQSSSDRSDAEELERTKRRVLQARFGMTPNPRRGLYLLSCHEGKGKEFDMVVLPHVSTVNFNDAEEEARQLLYVSLSRARHRLLVRLATGDTPPICQRLGLT
jgi:superfamily I DNA/RNA helicase